MTRVHVPIQLRWGDLDAFGHVNNASMLRLLEEARCRAFFRAEDSGEDAPPTAVFGSEVLGSQAGVATLIARQSIEYLRPVPYRHRPLDVQLWIGRLGGSSIDVCYEVRGAAGNGAEAEEVYARADAVVVLVDVSSGRPVRLAPEMRAAWEPYVEEPVAFSRR
ncbi:acyl-CoA thioesterase [Microbacterium betulae]|uniref:Acyl-CoA thioesterase n=1 Tax=Microbacterium betulae TaxID=2981139 RepID=A0AA97FJC0_9MICO|nr:acyl-CoA thioesterase [Microbacterium sp. AB]WOF24561.1 acyl-CoA thioesterase [Microbacterium sp. AB]